MVRDAELAARDYVALVCAGLPAETDINLVTATLRQAHRRAHLLRRPGLGADRLGASWPTPPSAALAAAEPGSGFQLAWARAFAAAARADEDLAVLRGWLDGTGVPAGLAIDTELRWTLLQALVANGAAGPAEIEAELDRRPHGQRRAGGRAAPARWCRRPETKAEVWRRADRRRSAAELAAPGAAAGLPPPGAGGADRAVPGPSSSTWSAEVWATRDSEPAQEFVAARLPGLPGRTRTTVTATDAWLAGEGHPAPLRRLVAEGRDGVVRALEGPRQGRPERLSRRTRPGAGVGTARAGPASV